LQPSKRLLVHLGDERDPVGEGVEAVGLRLLTQQMMPGLAFTH